VKRGIILLAHGARDPQWAEPFHSIRDHVEKLSPNATVQLAYLELMEPRLKNAVSDLVGQGVAQMTLVPLFMAQGGHLKEDLPKLVAEIKATHPAVTITITQALGESPALLAAIAQWVVQQAT
jgi:sirohydrochlorin cobaltochelatase